MAFSVFTVGRFTLSQFLRYQLATKCLKINCYNRFNMSSVIQSEQIKKGTVDQLLSCTDETDLSYNQSIQILQTLNKMRANGETKVDELLEDYRFLTVCNTLQRDCHIISQNSLLIGLQNILQIGLAPDMPIVKFLENEVLWRARKMSFKNLIYCLSFHKNYQESQLQKNVIEEVVQVIQKRWFEINDTSDVVRLLHHVNLFHEEFLQKIEDFVMKNLEKLTIDQCHKLLVGFSQINRRSVPLLRALAYQINQSTDKMNAKQLINIVYAINTLCFPDIVLLQRILNDLLVEIPNIDRPQLMSSLLLCIGQLTWRNKNLLECCSDWIIKHIAICRSQELATYVITLARINYHPAEMAKIFDMVLPRLIEREFEKKIWLDVVWSLAILNQVTTSHLSSVLKPSFYSSLIENDDHQSNSCKLKLLNLISVAIIEHPMIPSLSNIHEVSLNNVQKSRRCIIKKKIPNGFLLIINVTMSLFQVEKSDEGKQLTESIIHTLRDFVPVGKYMVTNQHTCIGISIGAEFIVDKNGKPLPIEKFGARSGLKNIGKPLPNDVYRIALLVWEYKDFTVDSQILTGPNALAIRLLIKLGYAIVEVPYTEYSDKLTPVNKMKYLQTKIKEAVQKK